MNKKIWMEILRDRIPWQKADGVEEQGAHVRAGEAQALFEVQVELRVGNTLIPTLNGRSNGKRLFHSSELYLFVQTEILNTNFTNKRMPRPP